jgi:hypothetical protein
MNEKGASKSIIDDVLNHLLYMGFPFKFDKYNDFNSDEDEFDDEDYEDEFDDEEKIDYPSDPSEWYFGVYMKKNKNDKWDNTSVGLNIDPEFFDTEIGSHNLPKNLLKILDDCGFDPKRDEDGFWELKPEYNNLSKKELDNCLTSKGLKKSNVTF